MLSGLLINCKLSHPKSNSMSLDIDGIETIVDELQSVHIQ